MKETIKRVLRGLPFDLTRNQRYDTQTKKIIRRCMGRDSNTVDVGCHKGGVLDLLLAQAPEGTHFAFEPIPELFEDLRKRYPANCRIHCLALSDEPGESAFNLVLSNPAYSGLVKRRYDRPHETDTTIMVKQDLLDNIIPDDLRIDFIKIDVEGGELGVLRGAKRTILRSRPLIVFEHGKGAADCYGTRPEQVHEFLADECGLEVGLMEGFLKGRDALDRAEFIRQFDEELNYYFVAYPGHRPEG